MMAYIVPSTKIIVVQLSYQALGSNVVGRRGIQALVLGAHFLK